VYNFTQFISIIRSINPRPNVVLNMRCGWLSQLDRQIVEPRLSGVDMIMGVSEHVTRGISDRFPGLAPICHTVNNGAHAVQTSRREVGQDVLFVGRVSPEKGVHVLLEAFAYLADRFPGTKLKVVGRKRQLPMGMLVGISDEPGVSGLSRFYTGGSLDEYQKYLEGRTTELGLEDRVTFTGFLPHSDVLDLYTKSYLLVNPSLSESFGRSLIEAMMAGIPVVASDAGGMGEIVRDGESGFLVEAGDSKGLASAMALLLGDRELGKRMGEAGRRVAKESYGWDLIAAKVYELYRNL
jgi:glycosyltransferase involved in cell wall biosynthesis